MATGTTTVGFEEQLQQAADKLRSNMDAAALIEQHVQASVCPKELGTRC